MLEPKSKFSDDGTFDRIRQLIEDSVRKALREEKESGSESQGDLLSGH